MWRSTAVWPPDRRLQRRSSAGTAEPSRQPAAQLHPAHHGLPDPRPRHLTTTTTGIIAVGTVRCRPPARRLGWWWVGPPSAVGAGRGGACVVRGRESRRMAKAGSELGGWVLQCQEVAGEHRRAVANVSRADGRMAGRRAGGRSRPEADKLTRQRLGRRAAAPLLERLERALVALL